MERALTMQDHAGFGDGELTVGSRQLQMPLWGHT
jgi:hypothetical protein